MNILIIVSLPISSEESKEEDKNVSYIKKVKGFIKKIGEKINKFIGKIKEKVKSVFSKKEKTEEVEEEKSTIDKKTIEFREALKAKENSKTSMRSIDIAADAIINPFTFFIYDTFLSSSFDSSELIGKEKFSSIPASLSFSTKYTYLEFREALKAKENSKTSKRSIDIAADAIIKPLDKNDGLEK